MLKLNKTDPIAKSVVGDDSIAYIPDDYQGFANALGKINNNDLIVEKYYARNLNKPVQNVEILTLDQLINIAIKKYKVPEFLINRFTNVCKRTVDSKNTFRQKQEIKTLE